MGVVLAVDSDRVLPGPLIVNESLVLGLLGVELGEAVGLPVRSDIEGRLSLVSTDYESTLDDGGV
jgi:hypothetical protein